MRLGEVVKRHTLLLGERDFIITGVHPEGYVLTSIPDGMTVYDLGRRFEAARLEPKEEPEVKP